MGDAAKTVRQGSIAWARLADRRGAQKLRPFVILTADHEIMLDAPIAGVAVTTRYPNPPPKTHVELPWHPRRHPATGLARRSAAVCDWICALRPSEVVEVKGYAPTKTLRDILERVLELKGPKNG